ncbi:MAG: tRNA 2-thiouridine(34) synthase MnmA [Nitrospirae bacterium]|nr:tRNA 2-thiouridine(34) synthase MnmA [Nitrospirota bacterium]
MKRKIVIAMSGGVDSSVVAALLARQGHEVVGVTMRLWGDDGDSASAVESARESCRLLGITHKVLDVRETFRKEVIDYFLDEYAAGLTPNPCVRCNEQIKFGILLRFMDLVHGERLATGHYARVLLDGRTGRYVLSRSADRNKDQSYFLYRLDQKRLSHSIFPLGDMTKEEVRETARRLGLPSADRADSQEVCFIPDNDCRGFVEDERPDAVKEGDFVDMKGFSLGRHRGIAFYTVGQRKGLGVSSPLGRRYVIDRDPDTNAITLGDESDLMKDGCTVGMLNWVAVERLDGPTDADVMLRYRGKPVPAVLEQEGGIVRVAFKRPDPGVSPGQSAVFYQGDVVLGGGVMMRGE